MSIIKHLKTDYHSFHLDIDHLEIADQGVTALIGPSGSGKTTILRLLSGLIPCPSLEWIRDDQNLAQLPIEKRRIGFVFQTLELFPHMTAYQNIKFAVQCSSVKDSQMNTEFLISSLSLESCLDTKADQLSGGEKQRVALARALAIRPQILFLDEPFSSLDMDNKTSALNLIKEMISYYNIPALLISHDKDDVTSLAHTIIQIEQGRIIKITHA